MKIIVTYKKNIGVSDENIGVADENIGVSDDNIGISDEAAGGASDEMGSPMMMISYRIRSFLLASNTGKNVTDDQRTSSRA